MSPIEAANATARRLLDAGHTTYFAGGCVRDQILGLEPQDFDIATSATPDQIIELFPRTESIGAHFGVVLVKQEGRGVEVATFRTDGSYTDGRRPESIAFSSPQEDAARRDFTINGLFQDPVSGEIIDYVGGRADLDSGLIRAIGDPQKRFTEDALRLLRAIRFATHTGFEIEPNTWKALTRLAPSLSRIAPERITGEFNKILLSPRPARGFQMLADSCLFDAFLPEVMALIGCDQPPQWHPEGDVFTHTRIMLGLLDASAPLDLCLAVVFHDIGKPATRTVDPADGRIRFNGHDQVGAEMTEAILRRLKYPNKTIENVRHMVARHMQFMNVQDMRTAKLKRFMSADQFSDELELHRVDCASSNGFTENYDFLRRKAGEFAAEPVIPPPLLSGHDLIGLGYQPGPHFKEILESIQTEQLEGRLGNRQQAVEFVHKHFPR